MSTRTHSMSVSVIHSSMASDTQRFNFFLYTLALACKYSILKSDTTTAYPIGNKQFSQSITAKL